MAQVLLAQLIQAAAAVEVVMFLELGVMVVQAL